MPEPKHRDILRVLKSRILRGAYEDRLPGDRVLAEELDVSPPTVKVALVQLEALGLVRRELRRGTFVVPPKERRHSGVSMSALLALRTAGPDSASQWVMETIFGFEEAAKQHGVDMIMVRRTSEETEEMINDVLAHLRSMTCVGACMLSFPVDTVRALHLRQAEGPVILVDWHTDDPVLPTVMFDNEQSGRLIGEHLLSLGHRNMLWIDVANASPERMTRWHAAEKVFHGAGAQFQFAGRPEVRSHQACADFLTSDAPPTAIIGGSAAPCIEIATIAGRLGIQIPRQLSVVAADARSDVDSWRFTGTVFNAAELGRKAFEMMLQVKPHDEIRTEKVPVTFVDNGTTAPPP